MPFLEAAKTSASHRSWSNLVTWGGGRIVVQSRTEEGLKKNASWRHQVAYKSRDMEPFRIVMNYKKKRYVIAVSQQKGEILSHWTELEKILSADPDPMGLMTPSSWPMICNLVRARRRLLSEDDGGAEDFIPPSTPHSEVSSLPTASPGSTPAASPTAPFTSPDSSPAKQKEQPAKEEQRGNQNSPGDGGTQQDQQNIAELWCLRLLRTFRWENPLRTAIFFLLFAHGAVYQWINWVTAITLIALSGFSFSSTSTDTIAPTKRDLQHLATLKSFVLRNKLHHASRFQSILCSVALIEFSTAAMFPDWRYLVHGLEVLLSGLIAVGLICSLVLHRFFFGACSDEKTEEVTATSTTTVTGGTQPTSAASPSPKDPSAVSRSLQLPLGKKEGGIDFVLESVMDFYAGKGWELKQERDGVKYFMKTVPWCKTKACLFSTFVPKVTPQTLEAILFDDLECKEAKSVHFTVDRLLAKREFHGYFNNKKYFMQRNLFKSPMFGVGPRELAFIINPCTYLTEQQQERWNLHVPDDDIRKAAEPFERDVFCYAGIKPPTPAELNAINGNPDGVEYPELPSTKGYVRGSCFRFGYIAQQVEDGVNFHLFYSLDPGGYIPTKAVDITNGEQIQKTVLFKKAMQEKGPLGASAKPASGCTASPPHDAEAEDSSEKKEIEDTSEKECPTLTRVLNLFASKDWVQRVDKNGVIMKDQDSMWCNKKALLVSTYVPGLNTATVEHLLLNDQEEGYGYRYDRLLATRKYLKDCGDGSYIVHSTYKSPLYMIAPRDMVTWFRPCSYLTQQQMEKYGLMISEEEKSKGGPDFEPRVCLGTGMPVPKELYDFPPVKGFQRGEVHAIGWIAQELPHGINIYLCMSVDPQGSIPSSVLERTNAHQVEKMTAIVGILKELGPRKSKVVSPMGEKKSTTGDGD